MKAIIILLTLMTLPLVAFAAVSNTDKTELQQVVRTIEQAVRAGNAQTILDLMSPNAAPTLRSEMEEAIAGKAIAFRETVSAYTEVRPGTVQVRGKFSASGAGWNIRGLSNEFTFEKIAGEWRLLETNFHKKFGIAGVTGVFKEPGVLRVLGILWLVALLLGAFSLWMLIDAAMRQFDNKALWILLIVLISPLGAIIYFFGPRRKHRQQVQQAPPTTAPPPPKGASPPPLLK